MTQGHLDIKNTKESIEKIEVLSEIYNELGQKRYQDKAELDTGKLKMKLIKKEILLLTYLIKKDLEIIE